MILSDFYMIGLSNAAHCEYARPGAWNDPDYLLIGKVGVQSGMGFGIPTTLSSNEQYSYMSMRCLMAEPDAFTLNVLCNHEVIAVDQDPLGKQARIIRKTEEDFILLKENCKYSVSICRYSRFIIKATEVTWSTNSF